MRVCVCVCVMCKGSDYSTCTLFSHLSSVCSSPRPGDAPFINPLLFSSPLLPRLIQFVNIPALPSITVIKDPHFPKALTFYQYQEQETQHVSIRRAMEAAAMGIYRPAPTRQRTERLNLIVVRFSLHPTTNYSSTAILL